MYCCFCGGTRIHIGASTQFKRNEIENAISCVQKENLNFREIRYDEEESKRILAEFNTELINSASGNFIAVSSRFKKNNILQENYIWILKRLDASNNWEIINHYVARP